MRLSHHAVEQFASRWGGTEADLRELAESATPTRTRTAKGQEVWLCGEGGAIRLVVKRDPGSKREPICVTVLPRTVERDPTEPGVDLDDLLGDLPPPPIAETVPHEDHHLTAAAAAVDDARDEVTLASDVYSVSRSFLASSKQRLATAKARLERLQRLK